jgi:hypothetical protein
VGSAAVILPMPVRFRRADLGSAASGEVSITLWEDAMAGENFCAESLQECRDKASKLKTIVWDEMLEAIAAAEMADHDGVQCWMDKAYLKLSNLRMWLQDLADERERQIDKEDDR